VTFAAITLCVASQRLFSVVNVYFVIDSVRKILDKPFFFFFFFFLSFKYFLHVTYRVYFHVDGLCLDNFNHDTVSDLRLL
jgi:hypothetical protein